MSVVSGVSLVVSFAEGCDTVSHVVGQWLLGHGFGRMVQVDAEAGGGKHPQFYAWLGGYDAFPEDEFAAFVLSLPWESPGNVVLTIQPERGPTRVWRPAGVAEACTQGVGYYAGRTLHVFCATSAGPVDGAAIALTPNELSLRRFVDFLLALDAPLRPTNVVCHFPTTDWCWRQVQRLDSIFMPVEVLS